MLEGDGAGGAAAPQILADQKAPPGSGGAPHYYLPPRFLDFATCLLQCLKIISEIKVLHRLDIFIVSLDIEKEH